ncbi:hypothetical protein SAMN04489835_4019 [Mycolicibacterium rutilum]|uniref:Uncharacterized protein n=1 Tax=Mycolicibacterium rutilum TaxID=370526 RepID=A0A1H6L0V1_MYCRU|nr:hypothetical protein [Mycolicibacterium rutilum]SEH77797.1 hypothetical protein SAMN04489835_4019 [Mycolicibacterium rutilum]
MTEQWQPPAGHQARQQPEETGERLLTWWQRALRWGTWLTFLGVAVANSQSVYFGPLEWLALSVAVGVSVWCMARPLGGPEVDLSQPQHLLGAFVSRTNWALLIIGAVLTTAGVAGAGAAVYDLSTGRATVGDVFTDIGVFLEGWFVELIAPTYDAELENTRAYALFLLILPGLLLLWYNAIPLFNRGNEFEIHADGSVSVRRGDSWEPLTEYQYASVVADGTTIRFESAPRGPAPVVLPQGRVFSRRYGVRLKSAVSAEFFRRLLAGRGFTVESPATGAGFTARRV